MKVLTHVLNDNTSLSNNSVTGITVVMQTVWQVAKLGQHLPTT